MGLINALIGGGFSNPLFGPRNDVLDQETIDQLLKKINSGDYTPLQSKDQSFGNRFMRGDIGKNQLVNQILVNAALRAKQMQDEEGIKTREQMRAENAAEDRLIAAHRMGEEGKIAEEKRKQIEATRQEALSGKAQALSGNRDFNALPSPVDLEKATPEQLQMLARVNLAKYGTQGEQKGLVSAVPEAQAAAIGAENQILQRKAATPFMSKLGTARAISDLTSAQVQSKTGQNQLLNLEGREPFEKILGETGGQSDLQSELAKIAKGKEAEYTASQGLDIARKTSGLSALTAELTARQKAGEIQDALDQAGLVRGVTDQNKDLIRKTIASKLQSDLFHTRNIPLTSNYYQDVAGGGWMNPAYNALLQSKVKPDPMDAMMQQLNQQRAMKGLPPQPSVGGLNRPAVVNSGLGQTFTNPDTGEVIYFNP